MLTDALRKQLAEEAERQARPLAFASTQRDFNVLIAIAESASAYLEARTELEDREDAHRNLVDAGEINHGDLDAVEAALTQAEEREALALANLRAKVQAW